ncbi:MAG: PrsW family intramembrane metalloprotease [Calditrichaeota bacterium]|nr:MAG: PrsW family intramembrane metalloprotease [Calditrichota bacterium]
MSEVLRFLLSLLPVFIFLLILIILDSYKLVKFSAVLTAIIVGAVVALGCLWLNSWILQTLRLSMISYSRYLAPLVEETGKALFLFYLFRSSKIGFMVDAAILGFAIGAGFAFVENIYYLRSIAETNMLLWIVRGFGTAIMHGSTTAIFGIIAKNFQERKKEGMLQMGLPALFCAYAIHSIFNHFILPPILTTLTLLLSLPVLMIFIFDLSEHSLQKWLGVGFDTDMALLQMIDTGKVSETRVGQYLLSLKTRFPGEVVADMLCLLKLHLELSLRAKGVLMMRETGFRISQDPEIKAKFEEMKYLEKSIGKTGKLAILPFLHTSSHDLWQLYMLGKK